jgi:hypothetical protein
MGKLMQIPKKYKEEALKKGGEYRFYGSGVYGRIYQ